MATSFIVTIEVTSAEHPGRYPIGYQWRNAFLTIAEVRAYISDWATIATPGESLTIESVHA